ncbi:hypothetical protein WA158_006036 [Blastocystis sp. Blastoise]
MDPLSLVEKNFILTGLKENIRTDGRSKLEIRPVHITLHRNGTQSSVEVEFGETKVVCIIVADVTAPFGDRSNEGLIQFNVKFSPMAGREFSENESTEIQSELVKVLERSIRESDAVDIEALCIIPGEKVFSLNCSITVLDNRGNLTDACVLATTACLSHYRRPDYSVEAGVVTIYSTDDRDPIPLSIHHQPICITFGIFDNDLFILDPNEREEQVQKGSISFILNAFGELCGIHKLGGIPMGQQDLINCAQIAATKVLDISKLLIQTLKDSDKA